MSAYYNEHDPKAAAWLRELIKQKHIADGEVDERSIEDVQPNELRTFTQCHFFAGIGVWSYALRRAGWSDAKQVWTGSCPCQPFSAAGKGGGFSDERHLWPAFYHLISECRPGVVFGEQVASKDGLAWLDLVQTDLENSGYAVGAVDTCAAGFGAPHLRQRLYWVADAKRTSRLRAERCRDTGIDGGGCSEIGGVADTISSGLQGHGRPIEEPVSEGRQGTERHIGKGSQLNGTRSTNGFWRDADWLFCRDGKWRPVEPGTFPLAHGAAARVGRLRGYGNAIVAEQAKAFIEAYREINGLDLV